MGSVCLEWSAQANAAMETMARETGAPDMAGLIQDALRVYEWVLDHQRQGHRIVVEAADGHLIFALTRFLAEPQERDGE